MPRDDRHSFVLLSSATATGAGTEWDVNAAERTYQVWGTTSAGSGAATIVIEVSNKETPSADEDWTTLATLSLTLGTTQVNEGTSSVVPWRHVRANVTAISGTDATVDGVMHIAAREA